MHRLSRHRMGEPNLCGMQHQPLALRAIKLVALDRTSQAIRMGTMNAKLVGTPCLRIERYEVIVQELVVRHRSFAVLHIHHLARTIHRVWTQRQRDPTSGRK